MYLFTSHLLVQRLAGSVGVGLLLAAVPLPSGSPAYGSLGGFLPWFQRLPAYPLPYFPTPATLAETTK